ITLELVSTELTFFLSNYEFTHFLYFIDNKNLTEVNKHIMHLFYEHSRPRRSFPTFISLRSNIVRYVIDISSCRKISVIIPDVL
ncbi:hypothetical protein L9F63_014484, partial [Diploptera punctata]